MKKLLTLAVVSLFTMAAMAADHYPSVTIKSRRNFEVTVDGRNFSNGRSVYSDNTIHLDRMSRGMHQIRVYERTRGFFGSRMRLVSSKNFFVGNNDLQIHIDRSGYIDVNEMRYGRGNDRRYDNDRGWDRNDRNRRWDDDDDDRDWDGRSHY